jgi:hypothetical protein
MVARALNSWVQTSALRGFASFATAAAGDRLEDLYLIAVLFDQVADVSDALMAGVRVVLVVVVGCCREGIASGRYPYLVHSFSPFLWAGPGECGKHSPGPMISYSVGSGSSSPST